MQLLLKSLMAQVSWDSGSGAASTISTDEDLTSSQIELTGENSRAQYLEYVTSAFGAILQ